MRRLFAFALALALAGCATVPAHEHAMMFCMEGVAMSGSEMIHGMICHPLPADTEIHNIPVKQEKM